MLIDYHYSVNGISCVIYSSDFNYLAASTSQDMVRLLGKILSADQDLLDAYTKLKKSLSADNIIKHQSDIPNLIENLFADKIK